MGSCSPVYYEGQVMVVPRMAFSLFSMVLSAVMTLDRVAPTAELPDVVEVASSMVEVLLMGLKSVVAKTDFTCGYHCKCQILILDILGQKWCFCIAYLGTC